MGERVEWKILGRVVGKADGWDIADTFVMMIYDFKPAKGVHLPAGTLNVDFERGVAETFDDDGKVRETVDLVKALAHLPLSTD